MNNNYNEVSKTSMPVDEVEAWLDEFEHKRAENKPNGGIIRSTESVIFVSGTRANMTKKERKAAIAQAQREHKAAMRELAIQDRKDRIEIARKQKEWAKEIRVLRVKAKPKGVSVMNVMETRKDALEARLRAGEHIAVVYHGGDTKNEYQTMRRDVVAIKGRFTNGIVRMKYLNSEQGYYMADTLETFDGDINYSDMDSIIAALKTKKAVRISGDMYQKEVKNLASMVRKIAKLPELEVVGIYGLNNSIKGWALK